jgi:HEAT repeat protein
VECRTSGTGRTTGRPTPESVREVRTALADPDPQARAAAAEAFGSWGEADEATRADLLALLDDANDEVKARAARVLPKLAGATPAVVDGLTRRISPHQPRSLGPEVCNPSDRPGTSL